MTAQERFERNIRLSYHVLSKHFPAQYPSEDYKQIAMLYLWIACLSFDESKGYKFSTYACTVMWNGIVQALRKERIRGGKDTVVLSSLDAPLSNTSKSEEFSNILDIMADPEDMYALIDLKDALEKLEMSDRAREILSLYMSGLTQIEISKRVGISQPQVSRDIKRIQERLLGCGLVG